MTMASSSPRRPRVLHAVTHLGLGGAERVAFTLMRAMGDKFDSGIFTVQGVDLDAMGRTLRDELGDTGRPLHAGTALPLKAGGLLLASWRLGHAMARFQPDILHLHTEVPEATYAFASLLRPAVARVPLVRTIHNAVYWAYWPRLGRWCERRMRSSTVAAVSEDARASFERFRAGSGAGALPVAPVVIYNGVAFPLASRTARPSGPLRLLFAGRLEFQKGADLLPAILAAVPPPGGEAGELFVYGSGREEKRLHAWARQPPAHWTVRIEPPHPDLIHRFTDFDLVIVPSRFEGLGLVAIEAIAAGVPVAITDAPGLRETMPPGYPWQARAGDAADFAAVINRALAERQAWPEAVQRARCFARERFDLGIMVAGYEALYARASAWRSLQRS